MYWSPQLYYQHGNGSFQDVPDGGMVVYYLNRGANASSTVAFPPGFRMVTGDSTLRSYDAKSLTYLGGRPIADRVSFKCLDSSGEIEETHSMTRTDCDTGMRAQMQFQTCWDGINTYKSDQSHVAYLSELDNGACPPTHPVTLPHLFAEVLYFVNNVQRSQGGRFVFANGDTTGYGFHADFLNGWDAGVLENAVKNCLNDPNIRDIQSCPILNESYNPDFPRTCPEQPPEVIEQVRGMLSKLPGCNPITSGPGAALQQLCPPGSDAAMSTSAGPMTAQTAKSTAPLIAGTTSSVSSSANIVVSSGTSTSPSLSSNTAPTAAVTITATATETTSILTIATTITTAPSPPLAAAQRVRRGKRFEVVKVQPYANATNSGKACASGSDSSCMTKVTTQSLLKYTITLSPTKNYTAPIETGLFANKTVIVVHPSTNVTGTAAFYRRQALVTAAPYSNTTFNGTLNNTTIHTSGGVYSYNRTTLRTVTRTITANTTIYTSTPTSSPTIMLNDNSTTNTSTISTSLTMPTIASVPNTHYLGCYSEPNPINPLPPVLNGTSIFNATYSANATHLLTLASFGDADSMTNAVCASFCSQFDAWYFGTGFSKDCYCGGADEQLKHTGPIDEDLGQCSVPCAGDLGEICGGGGRINLYEFDAWIGSDTTTTAASRMRRVRRSP